MTLKVSAKRGLLSGQFRSGPLHVTEDQWTDVDPTDEDIRKELVSFVGTHVRIHPMHVDRLAGFNLALQDSGRLIEVPRPVAPPPAAAAEAQAAKKAR